MQHIEALEKRSAFSCYENAKEIVLLKEKHQAYCSLSAFKINSSMKNYRKRADGHLNSACKKNSLVICSTDV